MPFHIRSLATDKAKIGFLIPDPQSQIPLSISIVHHDGLAMLRDCLKSLTQFPPGVPYEILVVDNASTDGAREMLAQEFSHVRVLCRERRHGFGDNHNRAIEAAQCKFLFLLNDDTLLTENAIDELLACMERNPKAAVVGARLENPDGTLQLSCYKFPSPMRCVWENLLLTAAFPQSRLFGDYRVWLHDAEQAVDFIGGAAMLVRREAIAQVGGFNERFFMYAEETDWQYRMNRAGGQTVFCPTAQIVHFGGRSTEAVPERQFVEFNRSQVLFTRLWYGKFGVIVQRVAMVFGSLLRLALWSIFGIVSPKRKAIARANVTEWARQLRWWSGFGSKLGLRELAEQAGGRS